MPITQPRLDVGRQLRNGSEGDENALDMDGEAAADDLFGMLSYRAP